MIRVRSRRTLADQKGFTIVELMIAMGVFAMVLLIITTAFIQISKVYYKGITETNTQNAARSVMDSISQAIQFNGGTVDVPVVGAPAANTDYAICIGPQRYTYRLGAESMESSPKPSQTYHAMVRDTPTGGCSTTSPPTINVADLTTNHASSSPKDLLGPRMRVAKFSITSAGTNLYKIQIRVVYGDDDLLNNPAAANASCKGVSAGSQFCSYSELSTIVQKRVQ